MTLDKEYQIPFADSIIYPWRRVSDTLVRADETMMDSAAEVTVKDALKALFQLGSGEVLTLNLTIKKVTGGTDPDKTEIVLTTGQITAWNSQRSVEVKVI